MKKPELDPNSRPPCWPRGPIPPGTYEARIVSTYLDHFQSQWLILALTWMVTGGDYASRRVFDWVLLSGDEESVNYGYGKFKAIAEAIGHPAPEAIDNSEELHDLPCLITVATVEQEDDPVNEVRGYAAIQNMDFFPSTYGLQPSEKCDFRSTNCPIGFTISR
ncbi:hypothetical protein C4J81_12760 [Deltaproteobacteria bacterium Smac51]|nr:hypothetical protein C4J81_12760 [Deltaproteobacteria bacterium Smac51]